MAGTELGPPPPLSASGRNAVADSAHVERIRRRAGARRRSGRLALYLFAVLA